MTYNISFVAVFWVSAQFLSYIYIYIYFKHIKKAIHDLNTFLDEHVLIHKLRTKKCIATFYLKIRTCFPTSECNRKINTLAIQNYKI